MLNWIKTKTKLILVSVLGALAIGVYTAVQETTTEVTKDLIAQHLESGATGNQLPSSHPEKPTISFGDHAQVGQMGDHNTQINITGTTDIELAKQLGVTETAIQNFFKLLQQQNVPHEELDHTLRTLAKRHKELEKRVSLLESEDPEVVALQQQAKKAIADAEYEKAEDLLDQAVELDNAAAEEIHTHYLERKRSAAENMALKAESLHTRFAFSAATKAYEQAIGFAEEGEAEEKIAEYQNMLGSVYLDNGNYDQARIYFEQALVGGLKTYGEDHPQVAAYRNNLGLAWRNLGEYEKAIDYYEQALTSDLKIYAEYHPSVAIRRNNLGAAWHHLGDYEKAIDYFEQALASDLKTYGEDHPSVARDRNNLGAAWDDLGDYEKAIGYYEQALASDLKTYGEDHPSVARDRNNLGLAWNNLGDYEKAIGYYEQALTIVTERLGVEHPLSIHASKNLEEAKHALATK